MNVIINHSHKVSKTATRVSGALGSGLYQSPISRSTLIPTTPMAIAGELGLQLSDGSERTLSLERVYTLSAGSEVAWQTG